MDSIQTLTLLVVIILVVIVSCAIVFLLWSKHFFDRQKSSFSNMEKLEQRYEERYWDFWRRYEDRYSDSLQRIKNALDVSEVHSRELYKIFDKLDKNYEELSDSIMRTTKLFRENFYGYEKQHLSTGESYVSPSSEKELLQIVEGLESTREIICSNAPLDMKAVSNLRTLFLRLRHHFSKQLNPDDEEHLKNAVEILNNEVESIDRLAVCANLDYFIAKFDQPLYNSDDFDSKRLTAS